jgi:hypothetical protein
MIGATRIRNGLPLSSVTKPRSHALVFEVNDAHLIRRRIMNTVPLRSLNPSVIFVSIELYSVEFHTALGPESYAS